jgi:hypothetical protein
MRMAPKSVMRTLAVPTVLGLLIALGLVFPACKKDEPPPPLPSASEAPSEPAPALTLAPEEDAGEDADADAKKATGPYKPAKSLANCCAALAQNAQSAPAPTNTYMMTAAGICQGMVAQGKDNAAILAAVRAAMKGAALPGGCQ